MNPDPLESSQSTNAQPSSSQTVDRLMFAVIQLQDAENVLNELNEAGVSATRLATTGGFLGRGNVTLIIGLSAAEEAKVIAILQRLCRRRIEYIATPLEGAPFHMPLPTPVSVGGATIFTVAVERYEVIP